MDKPEERPASVGASVRAYRPAARGGKTRKQLLQEISQLRGRIAELERAAASSEAPDGDDNTLVALAFDAHAARRRPMRAPYRRISPTLDKDRAYTHLRRQFDTMQAILDSLDQGVYGLDHEGRLNFLNAAARDMLGWTRAELLGRPLHERIHPACVAGEEAGDACSVVRSLTHSETLRAMNATMTHKNGHVVAVEYVSSPIISDGRVIGAVLAFQNVTRRAVAEAEAATRAAVLEATFDAMGDAVFVYANDGRLLRTNAVARALVAKATGDYNTLPLSDRLALYTVEDEYGAPLLEDATPVRRILRGETLSGGDAPDMVFVSPDGARTHLSVTGTPIYNMSGVAIGAVAILRDVTARRTLAKRNDEALETLRESTRLMDEFLSIASHELWNPLSAINASIQLAASQVERTLPGITDETDLRTLTQAHAVLGRAERQSGLLNRLVGDLLEISRINLGKLTLNLGACDIVEVAHEAVRAARLAWPGRKITIEATTPALQASADRDRIAQVLTNYLTNALKYSRETCSAHVMVARENDHARVSVRDQGPGLRPEEWEAVWLRFHRAPGVEVLSGSGVGLGLGLNISKTIIEEHGGAVGVESVLGEGSTFWFTLPLAE